MKNMSSLQITQIDIRVRKGKALMFTGVVCIYCRVPFPVLAGDLFEKFNIEGANGS